MRTVKIREISATVIQAAAESNEPLAITRDNVVCGVVIPVSPDWLKEVVHESLSRVVHSIQVGEKELASAPFVTLDDAIAESFKAPGVPPPRRVVSIREISGKLIREAAEHNETLAITSDHVLLGVLLPVPETWLNEVVYQNLSRIVRSIELGERELASEQPLVTLDDGPDKPRGRSREAAGTRARKRLATRTS